MGIGVTRQRGLPLAALGLSGALLAGCSTQFRYFSHVTPGGGDAYFKVPASWRVVGTAQLIHLVDPKMGIVEAHAIESKVWVVAFNGGGPIKASGLSLMAPRLFGEIIARPLSPAESKSYGPAQLRSELLNIDPVGAARSGNPYFRLLSYQGIAGSNGLRGSRFVVSVTAPQGGHFTVAQKGFLDAKHGWIYVIGVGCRSSCFAAHRKEINSVLNAWNVKESL